MTKRRLLTILLTSAVLPVAVVCLEPTHVLRGWLRGEAFYKGRPTSYWQRESERCMCPGMGWYRPPSFLERYFPTLFEANEWPWLQLISGDPDAKEVLLEMLQDHAPDDCPHPGLKDAVDASPEAVWQDNNRRYHLGLAMKTIKAKQRIIDDP